MKKILFTILLSLVLFLGVATFVDAQTRVRGYYRNNGAYVAPHYRSSSDSSSRNNWSTRGNVNPYTGRTGTKTPRYNWRY